MPTAQNVDKKGFPRRGRRRIAMFLTHLVAAMLAGATLAVLRFSCHWPTITQIKFRPGGGREAEKYLSSSNVYYTTPGDPRLSERQRVRVDIENTGEDGFYSAILPHDVETFRLDLCYSRAIKSFLPETSSSVEFFDGDGITKKELQIRPGRDTSAWQKFDAQPLVIREIRLSTMASAFLVLYFVFFLIVRGLHVVYLKGGKASQTQNALVILALTAVCIAPSLVMDDAETSDQENRTLAKFPDWKDWWHGDGDSNIPKKFEEAFNDRFFGRKMLADLHNFAISIFGKQGNSLVFVGKDNWYFLHSTLDDFANTQPYCDEPTFKKITSYLGAIDSWTKARGKKFVLFVAPDKCRAYPKMVRHINKLRDDSESYTENLLARLRERFDFPIIYPREECVRIEESQNFAAQLYYKDDTHWTPQGAYFTGYLPIMKVLGLHDEEIVLNPPWTHLTHKGDLSRMLDGSQDTKTLYPALDVSAMNSCAKIDDRYRKGIVTSINPNRKGKIYFIRDSFTIALTAFLAETFGECRLRRRGIMPEDYPFIRECDVIVLEVVERDLLALAKYIFPPQL